MCVLNSILMCCYNLICYVILSQQSFTPVHRIVMVIRNSSVFFKSLYRCLDKSDCTLKVQSCKLYNNKYMTSSTQTKNIDIVSFIAVLVFKLLSHKVLFINRKSNRNCWIFRILLKHVSDHLSVFFKFAWFYF